MLYFRTILLWLAFLLFIIQDFIEFNNISAGLFFRLIPSGFLLLWFLLSIFIKENLRIESRKLSKGMILSLRILRPSASLSIILGAIFKILHYPFSNFLLIAGIGLMALYSTLLCFIAIHKEDYNPDILDDLDD